MKISEHCNGSVQDLAPAPTGQKTMRGYQKHALTNVMKAAQGFNPKALDSTTTLAKELAEECRDLVTVPVA